MGAKRKSEQQKANANIRRKEYVERLRDGSIVRAATFRPKTHYSRKPKHKPQYE